MGNRFNSFIKSLTDHELAIYIGYQSESFLAHSKEQIKQEIKDRNLTKEELEKYFKTKLSYNEDNINICERCGSNKFFEDIDIEHQNSNYTTYIIEVKTSRCRLCNYNPSKAREKNFFKRIKRFFVVDQNKKSRVIKSYDWFDQ